MSSPSRRWSASSHRWLGDGSGSRSCSSRSTSPAPEAASSWPPPVWALLAGTGVMSLAFLMRRSLHDASPAARACRPRRDRGRGAVPGPDRLPRLDDGRVVEAPSVAGGPGRRHGVASGQRRAGRRRHRADRRGLGLRRHRRVVARPSPERHSIGTVQGSGVARARGLPTRSCERHVDIRACAGATAACYADIDPTALIYVPKGQLNGLFSPDGLLPRAARHARGRGLRDRLRRTRAPRSPLTIGLTPASTRRKAR